MTVRADRRRAQTWPANCHPLPRNPFGGVPGINRPHTPPQPDSILGYVRENMDSVAENVRRTCAQAGCEPYGDIRRELMKLTQAGHSQRQGKENV